MVLNRILWYLFHYHVSLNIQNINPTFVWEIYTFATTLGPPKRQCFKNMLIMFIYRAKYVWDAVQRMHACLTFLNWPRTSLNRHVSTHIYVPHVANVYKQCCYLIHVAVHIHKRFLNMVVHLYHHDTSYYRGIRLVTWIVDNKDIVTYHWSVNTQLHHCYICPLRPATQVHAGRCASSKHNPCSCVHIWQSAHIPSCIPVYNGGPVPHTTRRIGSKDPSSFYGVEPSIHTPPVHHFAPKSWRFWDL